MTTDAFPFDLESAEGWEEKCWGRVRHVFEDPSVGVSILQVVKGMRCSRHTHRNRHNSFMVLSGMIEVWEWENEQDVLDNPQRPMLRTLLSASNDAPLRVVAGLPHMFRVLQSGVVVEVYTPFNGFEVSRDDIHRYDQGGRD